MPNISIREIDSTSGGTTLVAQDVVFVPGFINKDYIPEPGKESDYVEAYIPTLCESVEEFETYFGKLPAVFETPQYYLENFNKDAIPGGEASAAEMFPANCLDPGYVYAKELLEAGLPVLYVRVNEDASEITVEHMYDVLCGNISNLWSILEDAGEYQELKYITTGGYPAFEYFNSKKSCFSKDLEIAKFDELIFNNAIKSLELTINNTFTFTYAPKAKNATIIVTTEDEMNSYLDILDLDSSCYVTAVNSLYLLKINEDNKRIWIKQDEDLWKSWAVTYSEGTGDLGCVLALYGITLKDDSVVKIGDSISVYVPILSTSTIVNKALECAANRGDCIVLVDHTDNYNRSLDPRSKKSVYYSISNTDSIYKVSNFGEFGAMFTPWCGYSLISKLQNEVTKDTTILPSTMPASFGYLKALANSIKTNANWLAIAGASRGVVNISKQNLNSTLRLSNAIADAYQPRNDISINAITNVKPYGYLIWGNRTLKNNAIEGNLTATSFLNTRNMVSDIKKAAYIAARRCMFEQNSDVLWINYKGRITPVLDTMVSGGGLSGYKLIKGTTTEKAKLVCTIRLYPIYAIESFDITVELADDEVTIS